MTCHKSTRTRLDVTCAQQCTAMHSKYRSAKWNAQLMHAEGAAMHSWELVRKKEMAMWWIVCGHMVGVIMKIKVNT